MEEKGRKEGRKEWRKEERKEEGKTFQEEQSRPWGKKVAQCELVTARKSVF